MLQIIINEEIKSLLPPLSAEEFAGLEASILKEGCLTPLIFWGNTLVDGHYRYEICRKHEIPFSVKEIEFASLEEAKLWTWRYQENRRNLTMFHRSELALKLKDAIAAKAKERQRSGGRTATPLPGSSVNTNGELASIAGVSRHTMQKVEFIIEHGDEETKDRLRRGDKGTSIDREYCQIKAKMNERLIISEQKITWDKAAGIIRVRKDTTPKELADWMIANLSVEYIREVVLCIFKEYRNRYGEAAAQHLMLGINKELID